MPMARGGPGTSAATVEGTPALPTGLTAEPVQAMQRAEPGAPRAKHRYSSEVLDSVSSEHLSVDGDIDRAVHQ